MSDMSVIPAGAEPLPVNFADDHFFTLPSQGSVYGLTRITGIIGANDKVMVVASSKRKVFVIDYNRSRRGVKFPTMRELPFTHLPSNAEIVAIDAFNKSRTINDFVVAMTLVRGSEEHEAMKASPVDQSQHLNIYLNWEPSTANSLEVVAQHCVSLSLPFTPFLLRHVRYLQSVAQIKGARARIGLLVSGSDGKVHLYNEEKSLTTFKEAPIGEVFPELDDLPSVLLSMDMAYVDKTKRLSVVGCECGFIAAYVVDIALRAIVQSWSVQHDGPVVSTHFWREPTDEYLNREAVRKRRDSDLTFRRPWTYHLVVGNSLQSSCVYRNILRDGLEKEYLLPESKTYDCVTSACVGDFNMDGCNEIALATYGQEVLIYCQKFVPFEEKESADVPDHAEEMEEHEEVAQEAEEDGEKEVESDEEEEKKDEPEVCYELIFQKSFASPILALDYADVTGDGMKELIVLTTRGISVIQHDFEAVLGLLQSRVEPFKSFLRKKRK